MFTKSTNLIKTLQAQVCLGLSEAHLLAVDRGEQMVLNPQLLGFLRKVPYSIFRKLIVFACPTGLKVSYACVAGVLALRDVQDKGILWSVNVHNCRQICTSGGTCRQGIGSVFLETDLTPLSLLTLLELHCTL